MRDKKPFQIAITLSVIAHLTLLVYAFPAPSENNHRPGYPILSVELSPPRPPTKSSGAPANTIKLNTKIANARKPAQAPPRHLKTNTVANAISLTKQRPATAMAKSRVNPKDAPHAPSQLAKADSQPNHNVLLGNIESQLQRYFRYPLLARKRGWQGTVLLGFDILADGSVDAIHVAKGSGYSLLDRSALNALHRIKGVSVLSTNLLQSYSMHIKIIYALTES